MIVNEISLVIQNIISSRNISLIKAFLLLSREPKGIMG